MVSSDSHEDAYVCATKIFFGFKASSASRSIGIPDAPAWFEGLTSGESGS